MAWENPLGTNNLALFECSTGIKQYSFVELSTASGKLVKPTTRCAPIGVLVSSGTVGSTRDDTVQAVQVYGVAKVRAGSTAINAGDLVSASSVDGSVVARTTDGAVGIALGSVDSTGGDSTGGIGQQIIPVLLQYWGIVVN